MTVARQRSFQKSDSVHQNHTAQQCVTNQEANKGVNVFVEDKDIMTCGMYHIVNQWTDLRSHERVSVAMVLPSGINPDNDSMFKIRVSKCGWWLQISVKADDAIADVHKTLHSYLLENFKISPDLLDYHSKVCSYMRTLKKLRREQGNNKDLWQNHKIFLGARCRTSFASASDGDKMFYDRTIVGPLNNGACILHVELVVAHDDHVEYAYKKARRAENTNENYQHIMEDTSHIDVEAEERYRMECMNMHTGTSFEEKPSATRKLNHTKHTYNAKPAIGKTVRLPRKSPTKKQRAKNHSHHPRGMPLPTAGTRKPQTEFQPPRHYGVARLPKYVGMYEDDEEEESNYNQGKTDPNERYEPTGIENSDREEEGPDDYDGPLNMDEGKMREFENDPVESYGESANEEDKKPLDYDSEETEF